MSERAYQKMLRDRQGLIEKFGPTREKIMMCVYNNSVAYPFSDQLSSQVPT